jgi:hypothetical protein
MNDLALFPASTMSSTSSKGYTKIARTPIHLWDLEAKYLCAIVGTCATVFEMRKLAIKSKIENPGQYSDYQLHNIFVNAAHDGTRPGRLLEKLFQQKFRSTIAQYRTTDSSEFEVLWENSLKGGDVVGSYYALLTNFQTTLTVRDKAVGDIHMLSHISGASCRIDLKLLPKLKKTNLELSAHINKLNIKHHKAVQAWQQKQTVLEKICAELNSRLSRPAALNVDLSTEQRQLEKLQKRNSRLSDLVAKLREEKYQFQQEISDLQRNNCITRKCNQSIGIEALTKKRGRPMLKEPEISNLVRPSDAQLELNLNGKKILYVGGRYRQVPHFKELIERYNGCLFYHDGGREDGDKRLSEMLLKVDLVICPIDCISHNAIECVKRNCQKLNKRFIPLRRSSLSALARALEQTDS